LVDGRSIVCAVPITDDELALYKRSPETFFGVLRPVPKGIKAPLDAYDFVFESYSKSSRKLLEFMADRRRSSACAPCLSRNCHEYAAQSPRRCGRHAVAEELVSGITRKCCA
jgi:hypothetical protein